METIENLAKEKRGLALQQKKGVEQQPGLVLVEKHFETLDAMLQAYEMRLKPLETLEERCRKYPNPLVVEARQLEIYQRLIEVACTSTRSINQKDV